MITAQAEGFTQCEETLVLVYSLAYKIVWELLNFFIFVDTFCQQVKERLNQSQMKHVGISRSIHSWCSFPTRHLFIIYLHHIGFITFRFVALF